MPDELAWGIVGDLIQGIGTVVIAKPEGDMRKYFATLERLIALNPRVIIPSHGMALGTVYRLEETLKHRRQREQQVLSLWREGKDLETMLGETWNCSCCSSNIEISRDRKSTRLNSSH